MAETVVKVKGSGTKVIVSGGAARRITLDARTVAALAHNRPKVVTQPQVTPVAVASQSTVVRAGSAMGMQGPRGPAGPASSDLPFQLTAGAGGISALRVVVAEDGVSRYPDTQDPSDAGLVVGLSYTAADEGDTHETLSDGIVNEPLWDWAPGPVWCGDDGVLTQTLPAAPNWLMQVGVARTPTSLVLDIQKPILRS